MESGRGDCGRWRNFWWRGELEGSSVELRLLKSPLMNADEN
jgi:hypothetical protein